MKFNLLQGNFSYKGSVIVVGASLSFFLLFVFSNGNYCASDFFVHQCTFEDSLILTSTVQKPEALFICTTSRKQQQKACNPVVLRQSLVPMRAAPASASLCSNDDR